MPTNVNPWLIAKDLVVLTITPVLEGSDGALTDQGGSLVSIRAYVDDISGTGTMVTENICPAVSTLSNPVALEASTDIEISEIKRRGAASSNLKNLYYGSYNVFRIIWTEGIPSTVSGAFKVDGYYRFVACKDGTRKGKNVCVGTFQTVDISSANPVVSPAQNVALVP